MLRTLFAPWNRLLVEVRGVLEAPPDQVAERLRARFPSAGEPYRFAVQGGWWYRGEYDVERHPDGARVTHRVRNIAKTGYWGVPLANRFFLGFRPRVREGMGKLLREIGLELGCESRLD